MTKIPVEDNVSPKPNSKCKARRNKKRRNNNVEKRKIELKRCMTMSFSHIPNITEESLQQIQTQTQASNEKKNKVKKKNKKIRSPQKCSFPPEILANPKLKKYWFQRGQLFSKFDQGIKLDLESWYSVTPEKIAIHHADRCRTDGIIIDAFCGCGGNSIQFAKTASHVYGIDIDEKKLELAKINAKIYGVENKITFIHGDFMVLAPCLKADIVFLSPPWGGPDYNLTPTFDLTTMTPVDGIEVFRLAQTITPNIGYYLPKNVDPLQLAELSSLFEFERNQYNGKDKAVTAYFGNLIRDHNHNPNGEH